MDATTSSAAAGDAAGTKPSSSTSLDKRNQPKSSLSTTVLMSSLLDTSARLRAEAEQKRMKRKRTVPIKIVGLLVTQQPQEQIVSVGHSRPSSIAIAAQKRKLLETNSKWNGLVGQPGVRASNDDGSSAVRNPVNQMDWESHVRWEGGVSSTTTEVDETTFAASLALDDDEIVWDEEETLDKSVVPEPKRIKLVSWDLPLPSSESVSSPTTNLSKLVAKETSKGVLGRNESLAGGDWMSKVVWDDATAKEEEANNASSHVSYHVADEAFALDEMNRKRLVQQRMLQQEKFLLKQQQLKDGDSSATTLDSKAATTAAASAAVSAAASAAKANPALKGTIAAPPPQIKNIPGRGPPKKELLQRRYAQYGELLRMMGILETSEGVPLPAPLPPPPVVVQQPALAPPTSTTEDIIEKSSDPTSLGWKSIVPMIRHSEPSTELEWFDPQFRFVDPVKSFRRPAAFHREKQTVKLVMDPVQFDQQVAAAAAAVGAVPGVGGGTRVDVGASQDPNLNELELAVSSRTWRKKDLSSKHGKIFLFEYAEQFPLLLNGIGMASQMINFYRQEKTIPPKPEFGLFVGLNPDEISPLLTRVDPGKVYRVLHNNMMNVPVFEHRPSQQDFLLIRGKRNNAPSATTTTTTSTPEVAMVRRINRMFVCGQVEPQMEIFHPNDTGSSRTKFLNWLEKYMEFHFATRLKRREDMRIQFQTASELFNIASEKMVERALGEVAERETLGGETRKRYWVPLGAGTKTKSDLRRDLEEKRRLCLTTLKPEDCCSWEQLQLGLARLSQAGIDKVSRTEVPRVMEAYKMIRRLHLLREFSHDALMELNKTNKVPFPRQDTARQNAAARYVVRELELTPWYLSYCHQWLHLHAEGLHNPFPPNTVMRVTGLGDPSGRGEMVSFLPSYRHVLKDSDKKKESIESSSNAIVTSSSSSSGIASGTGAGAGEDEEEMFFDWNDGGKKKTRKKSAIPIDDRPKYGGTENDLRIVKMEVLGEILVALGVPAEEVAKISRWDRTWLIEKAASSSVGAHLLGGSIARYARIPGSNNPSLEMATSGTNASGSAAVSSSSAPGDVEAGGSGMDPRDELAARKRLEETQLFIQHRERVTRVYERMMSALEYGNAQASVAVVSASQQQDIDDDDLLDFAEGLKESLLTQQEEEQAAALARAAVGNKKDAGLQDALAEKLEFERFKRQVESGETTTTTLTAPVVPVPVSAVVAPRVGWTPFRVLKRTIIEQMPNGQERVRVEYHKSSDTLREFELQQQEKQNELRESRSGNKSLVRRSTASSSAAPAQVVRKQQQQQQQQQKMKVLKASPLSSSSTSEREKQKVQEKARANKVLQKQHSEWYRAQVEEHGRDFYRDYVEDDSRLPSTMPRRGGKKASDSSKQQQQQQQQQHTTMLRCSMCFLPGHNQQSALCPLYEVGLHSNDTTTLTEEGKIKVSFKHLMVPSSSSSSSAQVLRTKDIGLSGLAPGPLADLSKKFLIILDALGEHPSSQPFQRPVDRRTLPQYYKIVQSPMDLSKIRSKASQGVYKRRETFFADLQLMFQNSVMFNGPDSEYTRFAKEILELAHNELQKDAVDCDKLEAMIQQSRFVGGGFRGGKKKKTSGMMAEPDPVMPMEGEEEEIIIVEEEEPMMMIEEGEEMIVMEEGEETVIEDGEVGEAQEEDDDNNGEQGGGEIML